MINGFLRFVRVGVVILGAATLSGTVATPRAEGKRGAHVAPPESRPHGMTYEEWAGALLHWVYGQPPAVSPLIDSTGVLTQAAESGKVWFLPGPSELLPQPEQLSITMPEGTAIFFSPLGFYAAGPTAPPFDFCPTAVDCRYFVKSILDTGGITAQDVEIDGEPVSNINRYLILSPVVPLLVPMDPFWSDFVGSPGPFTFGVFGGFGLFIEPFPPGQHTIHAVTNGGGSPFEITYTITVTHHK